VERLRHIIGGKTEHSIQINFYMAGYIAKFIHKTHLVFVWFASHKPEEVAF
jgi:hypothetical protein